MNVPGFLSDRFLESLAHPQPSRGSVIPSLRSALVDCVERCADDPDFEFCYCLCRNSQCRGGRCIPQPCWPTF